MSSISITGYPNGSTQGVMQSAGLVPEQKPSPVQDDKIVAQAVEASQSKPADIGKFTEPTKEVVAKAVEQLQAFVESMGRNLTFSIDQNTGYRIVRVVDPSTGELIRQMPSEEVLRIAQNMTQLNNALVSQRA